MLLNLRQLLLPALLICSVAHAQEGKFKDAIENAHPDELKGVRKVCVVVEYSSTRLRRGNALNFHPEVTADDAEYARRQRDIIIKELTRDKRTIPALTVVERQEDADAVLLLQVVKEEYHSVKSHAPQAPASSSRPTDPLPTPPTLNTNTPREDNTIGARAVVTGRVFKPLGTGIQRVLLEKKYQQDSKNVDEFKVSADFARKFADEFIKAHVEANKSATK